MFNYLIKKPISILLTSFSSLVCLSQYPELHNRYKNTLVEMSDVISYHLEINKSSSNGNDIHFYGGVHGYMLLVSSKANVREIESQKLEWLLSTFKSIDLYDIAKDLFRFEVLISTDAGDFWLPIQNGLLEYWQNELKTDC